MNIAQIKQLQTVDGWIDCGAQIKEVKEIKQRTKSNLSKTPGQAYNVQKLVVQDETDTIGLWAYANQQFLPGQVITIHGMVKEYQNKRYLDYCDIKTDQNTHQNTQQAPSQPTQATNKPYNALHSPQPYSQGKKEPDWDAITEGKVRHGILCAMLQGGVSVDYPEVLRHTVFVMTGKDPNSIPEPDPSIQNNPDYVGDEPPPPTDDNIPF